MAPDALPAAAWSWRQAQCQGRLRKPCEGHTISVVGQCIYVLFGKHEDDHGIAICPPMQVLDVVSLVLTSPGFEEGPDGRTNVPAEREGHTASVVGLNIFVFGGTWTDEDENTLYLNDLHRLDTSALTWHRTVANGTPPIEREGHTSVTIGAQVYIFGGTWVDDEDNSIYLNDLHRLTAEVVERPTWDQPVASGEPPIPREGHTASVVGSQMVVFGGAGLDFEERSINLNDLHVLDTETMAWSQPQSGGGPSTLLPQERRYHSASVVGDEILVFGGQYYDAAADLHFECDNALCVYDLRSHSWSMRPADVTTPLRRACHAAGVVGKAVYLIGGRYWDVAEDDYIFLNDIQVLSVQPTSTLVADWRAFVNSPHLSDITIEVGGHPVHAHRVVLAARCSYFRAMFESGMSDATSPTIAINDIDEPVFLALLHHLYTDAVDISPDLALPLFAAADFLGVEHLKTVCVQLIEADLSSESVCRALTVADKHSASALKEACVEYIVANFRVVHMTEGFKELPRSLLDLVHQGISARLAAAMCGLGTGGSPTTPTGAAQTPPRRASDA